MRLIEIILRGVRRFSVTRVPSQTIVKKIVLNTSSRNILNKLYQYLNYSEREIFHSLYAKIFRNYQAEKLSATWKLKIAGAKIDIPIEADSLWLHWDSAVSILGHDVEIKQFYEKLLKFDKRPSCFFDIGANYGTHSIIFLVNGIKTITFEPNPNCYEYFDLMAETNNVQYDLMKVAVGERMGQAQLFFPKKDTWLGSLSKEYQNSFDDFNDLMSIEVKVITLDDYVQERNLYPDLIKIDTEGFELNVLKGGKQTIAKFRPLIIFESNKSSTRKELLEFFDSVDYIIFDLKKKRYNRGDEFLISTSTNFLGISKIHELRKK